MIKLIFYEYVIENGLGIWNSWKDRRKLGRKNKDSKRFVKEGNKLGELGKYDEAFKCFDKATKLDPKNDKAWSMMGTASSFYGKKLKKGEKQEKLMWQSVKCYKKAHELNPENPDLFEDAEFRTAIDEYDRNA